MALSQRPELRPSQSLVMTPQLQQAIRLLQFSNLELAEYVELELQRNPLLERDDGQYEGEAGALAADGTGPAYDSAAYIGDAPDPGRNGVLEVLRDADGPTDVDYDNRFGSADISETDDRTASEVLSIVAHSGFVWQGGIEGCGGGLGDVVGRETSLREHLYEQMGIDVADPGDRIIGAHLIEMLDDTGYVTGDIAEISRVLGCLPEQVETVLRRMQDFDPPGVFARDLAECLTLQLKDRNRLDPAMWILLGNLELLARRDLATLRRLCRVDDEDFREMLTEIRSLDPKPGLTFQPVSSQPIIPDILMRADAGGNWILELNPASLPRVLINNSYLAQVGREPGNRPDRMLLNEYHQSASWLSRTLHQRATTILKVANEIVRQQNDFFRFGVRQLKPLILRDIAEVIGMHESTVSRVTSNKYIETPRGIFKLKYFFTVSIASVTGGGATSAEAVRSKIKSLIDAEPADAVLSDDRLVELLNTEGIAIARRTVAKYREAMRIPSTIRRRREKRHLI